MRRVLVPLVPALGERVRAGPAESHHLLRVIQLPRGESVRVMDGNGKAGVARLVDVDGLIAVLEVQSREDTERLPARVVLLGVPKPALLEEALTLGTEGGATRFVLVQAAFSPNIPVRADRLERVLRAAVTQCGRADLPTVDGPSALSVALRDATLPSGGRWLAAPGAPPLAGDGGDGMVAIGPEGGWAPAEIELLVGASFVAAGLGPHVLRTPSAVGAALARMWGRSR